MNQKNNYNNKREKGFTLIELMMSMVVFLIAIAAVFGVLRIASVQSNTINTRTDALKGAKIALEYIRRDTMNAGLGYTTTGGIAPDNFAKPLFNIPADADDEKDFLTGIMAGNNVNPNSLNSSTNTDTIAFTSQDTNFNNGQVLRFGFTEFSGNSTYLNRTSQNIKGIVHPNDLLAIEFDNSNAQILGVVSNVVDDGGYYDGAIELIPGDALGLNEHWMSSLLGWYGEIYIRGKVKKLNLVSYNVTEDGVLVRKSLGNQLETGAGKMNDSRELVYGVKDFQIKYLLDDGTMTDDPSKGNEGRTNQLSMNRVVSIEVSITVTQDDTGLPQASEPITFKETICPRNLRYPIG